jgi:hypothetical protein
MLESLALFGLAPDSLQTGCFSLQPGCFRFGVQYLANEQYHGIPRGRAVESIVHPFGGRTHGKGPLS